MSAERDRMRRILGIELAEAGRRAGVTGPIERRSRQDTDACADDGNSTRDHGTARCAGLGKNLAGFRQPAKRR